MANPTKIQSSQTGDETALAWLFSKQGYIIPDVSEHVAKRGTWY